MNRSRYFCNDCVIFATYHLKAQKTAAYDVMMNGKFRDMNKITPINEENHFPMGFFTNAFTATL